MSGAVIRSMRKQKGLTLSELAQMVGVSSAHISQVERDKLEPSLGLLLRISHALDIPIPSIFSESSQQSIVIVRAGQGAAVRYQDLNVTCRMLTGATKKNAARQHGANVMSATLPPGIWVCDNVLVNTTDECIYAISGCLHVHTDGTICAIEKGGSVFIHRGTSYRIHNPGPEDAQFIWAYAIH